MRPRIPAALTPTGAALRLNSHQKQLIGLALKFHEDVDTGDRSLLVHLGADRAAVAQLSEKIRGGEAEFRPEEVHVLVMALRSASVTLPGDRQFYECMHQFYRDDVLELARGLESAIQGNP